MDKLKSIIIDDEFHGRENLKILIEKYCPEIEVIDSHESASTAKHSVLSNNPDVVFLDINMPELSGFDFLESFDEINFMTVFVTAHEEFGIKAVKAHAVDYLLKPVDFKELQKTVKNLLEYKKRRFYSDKNNNSQNIVIPVLNGFEIINSKDIIRFEGDDCYTKVFTNKCRVFTVSRTLRDFELVISDECFFRIHKSHIINLRYFKNFTNIDGGYITIIDGTRLPLSRRRVHDFIIKIKLHPELVNNEN